MEKWFYYKIKKSTIPNKKWKKHQQQERTEIIFFTRRNFNIILRIFDTIQIQYIRILLLFWQARIHFQWPHTRDNKDCIFANTLHISRDIRCNIVSKMSYKWHWTGLHKTTQIPWVLLLLWIATLFVHQEWSSDTLMKYL